MNNKHALQLVADALAIEEEEARRAGAVGFMARMLVQATMPHSKPGVGEIKHSRSNGLVTVSMVADPDVGLPYGHYPRLLLAWITTEAVQTKSPVLELGDSLSSFMQELGLAPTGGRWGTVTRLRNHIDRLFHTRVDWVEDDKGLGRRREFAMNPIDARELWWDPKRPDQADLWKSTIALSERFFRVITDRPVPVDMRALQAFARMKSPLAIDIYTWLTHRMSYLRQPTTIPWAVLQKQFGGDYNLTRQFKAKFIEKLKVVRTIYPAARLEVAAGGLTLAPSPTHVVRASAGRSLVE